MAVKATLPRLRASGNVCPSFNVLTLFITLDETQLATGQAVGYYGSVRLTLQRMVIILDTGKRELGSIWTLSLALSGSRNPRDHVTRLLERLLTDFAADYYRAGNP